MDKRHDTPPVEVVRTGLVQLQRYLADETAPMMVADSIEPLLTQAPELVIPVIREAATVLLPFMMLFGMYVIVHGEDGPGGGFQGGVIVAAAFILHSLLFGPDASRRALGQRVTTALSATGVLMYAGVGVAALLLGGAFLEYGVLRPTDAVGGQILGITLVETGADLDWLG